MGDDYLKCTGPAEPANFRVFSAGPILDGLPAADFIRRCDNPSPPEEPIRANYISIIYGTCKIPVDEQGLADGGCAPPLEVQTWPACERSLGDLEPTLSATSQIRGVPALAGGDRLELYAGRSTVVLFGDPSVTVDAAQALRAVDEPLVEAAADPGTLGPTGRQVDELPAPAKGAMNGGLSCAD